MKKKIIVSVLCLALLIFSISIYAEAEGDNKELGGNGAARQPY